MLKSKHIKQYLLLNAETLFNFYPMFWADTLEKIKIKSNEAFWFQKFLQVLVSWLVQLNPALGKGMRQ